MEALLPGAHTDSRDRDSRNTARKMDSQHILLDEYDRRVVGHNEGTDLLKSVFGCSCAQRKRGIDYSSDILQLRCPTCCVVSRRFSSDELRSASFGQASWVG